MAVVFIGLMTKIEKRTFTQAVDNVLEAYHRHPEVAATMGLLFSVVALIDSLDDMARIKQVYAPQLRAALLYENGALRLQRLEEIRQSMTADKNRQVTMGLGKAFLSVFCGSLAWITGPLIPSVALGVATLSFGSAATLNMYNYAGFNELFNRLQADGRIRA